MVADSITDSQLLPGSPISRDFFKKRKANWVWKLKQLKIDARRRHLISQWKRANLGEEESGCSRLTSLRDKPPDIKTLSERFSYLQAWSDDHHHELPSYDFLKCDYGSDDDDETDLSASSSPTSVLKNKDSDSLKSWDDCFCCSSQIIEEEEEEAFDDADDTYEKWDEFSDALDIFDEEDPNPNTSQKNKCKPEPSPEKATPKKSSRKKRNRKKKNKPDQKKEDAEPEIMECPICFEEMDATDLLFSPCPCTFKLCLFCFRRINEHDGCCPSCRKKYERTIRNSGEVSFQQRGRGTVRLSRSFKALDRA